MKKRPIGRRRISALTVDDVASTIAAMQKEGLKAWTIRGALKPLSRTCAYAIRKGWLSSNPVRDLEKEERPKSDQREMRILDSREITKMLDGAKTLRWRALFSLLVFTGMRISEALALKWEDVDFTDGVVTVRNSKTEAGRMRRIVLMPALGKVLREHWLASSHKAPEEPVFATVIGGQLRARQTLRALETTLRDVGVPHATQHELRQTFASILIGQGLDITFVANQLGHKDPQITLRIYAKLFNPEERMEEARAKLERSFGSLLAGG